MSGKRIKDLTTASSITNNDYLGMDNANNSAAKKISAMPLLNVNAIANIQNNLVANKAYAIGDQFVYQGNVYKATASIASGATITINGNCALVDSLADQATQIKASLTSHDYELLGTKTDGTSVAIDASKYEEFIVVVYPQNAMGYTIKIPAILLSSTQTSLGAGSYGGSQYGVEIGIHASTTFLNVYSCKANGSTTSFLAKFYGKKKFI